MPRYMPSGAARNPIAEANGELIKVNDPTTANGVDALIDIAELRKIMATRCFGQRAKDRIQGSANWEYIYKPGREHLYGP